MSPDSVWRYSPGLTTVPGPKRTPCCAMCMSPADSRWVPGKSRRLRGGALECRAGHDAGARAGVAAAEEALDGGDQLAGAFQLRAVAAVVDEVELRRRHGALQGDAMLAGDEAVVLSPDEQSGDGKAVRVAHQASARKLANDGVAEVEEAGDVGGGAVVRGEGAGA